MVYSSDILNTNGELFSALTLGSRLVTIDWNNYPIHLMTEGPTPLLKIDSRVDRSNNGMELSTTTTFNLQGTLFNTNATSGISFFANKIKDIRSVFSSGCGSGILSVKCNNNILHSWSGVRFVSSEFNPSSDQWTITCPYSISLEQKQYAISGGYKVKNISDKWVIEQLEDYLYTNMKITGIVQRAEDYNPSIGITTAPRESLQRSNLDIVTIPQFRVSRTVSAMGEASGCSLSGINNSSYLEAKRWVEDRIRSSWSGVISTSGMMNFVGRTTNAPTTAADIVSRYRTYNNNNFFYNYLRTSNVNVIQGSYEVSETFLVLPTGIGYYEDYSVEVSTDDKHIVTASVNGTINGLSLFIPNVMGSSQISSDNGSMKTSSINLSGSLQPNTIDAGNVSLKHLDDLNYQSKSPSVSTVKYQNAVSGWLRDIKPYVYRRACSSTNSQDRNRHYSHPTQSPAPPLNNPVYSFQAPLNIIPISTSETHDPRKGIISYSYQFNNRLKVISGTTFENITVDDTLPNDVFSEAFVLGRALGPVLQSLNTKTAAYKTLSIEIGVVPPSTIAGFKMQHPDCPVYVYGPTYRAIQQIVSGFQPFGVKAVPMFPQAGTGPNNRVKPTDGDVYVQSDVHNWNATQGRYTRTIKWIYQQCNNTKKTLDH